MRVGVIGGGIQGCCIALELVNRGVKVDLIEKRPRLMDAASRHSEGKIHLGFVYANDPSLRTAELMVEAAMKFARYMRRWLGPAFDTIPVSTPFEYLVHRASLVAPDVLEDIYQAISQRIASRGNPRAYFGIEDSHRITRASRREVSERYGPEADAVFSTREVAVDPDAVADLMTKVVMDTAPISVMLNTEVRSVDSSARKLVATRSDAETVMLGPYDHVVNCSWEGRPGIDATVGIHPPAPWSFRMKYFVRAAGATNRDPIPSVTIVLGPFGDVVDYGVGDYYLSWYPTGRRGWSSDIKPPDWPSRAPPDDGALIKSETFGELSRILPRLEERFDPTLSEVRGGIIYALGKTDVDDPMSRLHQRSAVGIVSQDGWYHTVDTGKYTTAPLFAMKAADSITQT